MPMDRTAYYADASTPAAIVAITAAMADAEADAIAGALPYVWANAADRTAQTGMALGYKGLQVDTGIEWRYDGSAWKAWESDWITYTPTMVNVTVGSGIAAGRYKYESGRVIVEGRFTYGSGSGVSSTASVTHPASLIADAISAGVEAPIGYAIYLDSAVASYPGVVVSSSTTVGRFLISNTASTYAANAVISGTVPFTWASSDAIIWHYEFTVA